MKRDPRKTFTLLNLAATLSLAGALPASEAYLHEDHYYSVRVISNTLRPLMDGEALVGICAQLPDEAPEISAIDVYRRLMRHPLAYGQWVLFNNGPSNTVGRMVTIHQVQHGLTGGPPEAVRQVAKNVIGDVVTHLQSMPRRPSPEQADALCALGLAFHLYGDSFSHQMISNAAKTYRPGIGHLFDSTRPDIPLFSGKRLRLWKQYLSSLPDLLPHSEMTDIQGFYRAIEDMQPLSSGRNGYNLLSLRKLVASQLQQEVVGATIIPFDRSFGPRGCQAVIDRQVGLNGLPYSPNCARAWTIYRDLTLKEYASYDRQHTREPSRPDTRVPAFLESPFSPDSAW